MEANKAEVLPGALILLVLRTLDALGPLHGYGIARRIAQISHDLLLLKARVIQTAVHRSASLTRTS